MSKTVMITGSSRGLGRSLALVFARNGYNIILHGRNKARLAEAERAILNLGVACDVVAGDITSSKTIAKLCVKAVERKLDVLINNAGIYGQYTLGMSSAEKIKVIIETNLIAPVLLMNRIFSFFIMEKKGLIININSTAGKHSSAIESVYCASKHGLKGFTSSIRFEAIKHNIRIIDVYLGAMQTEIVADRFSYDKFMRLDEVADLIFDVTKNYKSLTIKEIDIGRRNY